MATEYARSLAVLDRLESSKAEGQGENLLVSASEINYVDAVNVWLAEVNSYDGKKIGEGLGGFGHFSKPETSSSFSSSADL